MGLNVSVYKFPLGDCTNNGISKGVSNLCLVNVDGPSTPSADSPAALLVRGNGRGLVKVVPAICEGEHWVQVREWTMMGGNYAATSDGRFHDAVRQIIGAESYGAVPIHDRIEN